MSPFLSKANYQTYWCAPLNGVQLHQNEGYLFGGYYTSKVSNPITGAMSCPRYFYPVHMLEDTKVCVSTDYERAFAYAVDFAGFESCSMGNPLADSAPSDKNVASWPHACPHGYAQHLVTVEDGCEINFCVHVGALNSKSLASIKLPPFRKHPKYKENVTETLVVFGVYGEIWTKNEEGGWDKIDSGSQTGQALLSQFTDLEPETASGHKSLSSGVVAVISVISTLVFGLGIAAVVFIGQCVVKKRKEARRPRGGIRGYGSIGSADGDQESNIAATVDAL